MGETPMSFFYDTDSDLYYFFWELESDLFEIEDIDEPLTFSIELDLTAGG